jgi:hypothetical protein
MQPLSLVDLFLTALPYIHPHDQVVSNIDIIEKEDTLMTSIRKLARSLDTQSSPFGVEGRGGEERRGIQD